MDLENIGKGEPARGSLCQHFECFDSEQFLKSNLQIEESLDELKHRSEPLKNYHQYSKMWKCRLCGERVFEFVTDKFYEIVSELVRIGKFENKDKGQIIEEVKNCLEAPVTRKEIDSMKFRKN